jgi:hypothetical protein
MGSEIMLEDKVYVRDLQIQTVCLVTVVQGTLFP